MEKFEHILLLGDSLSKGVVFDNTRNRFSLIKENFCALVGSQITATLENVSKMGSTISRGRDMLEKRMKEGNAPDLVVIEFGGNDCDFDWEEIARSPQAYHAPKTELAVFEKNLLEMIEGLGKRNITPILLNLPPIDAERYFKFFCKGDQNAEHNIMTWLDSISRIYWWHERYNSAIEDIAERTQTRMVNIRRAFLEEPDYRVLIGSDGIHPNPKGHRKIAEKVLHFISTNCQELLRSPGAFKKRELSLS